MQVWWCSTQGHCVTIETGVLCSTQPSPGPGWDADLQLWNCCKNFAMENCCLHQVHNQPHREEQRSVVWKEIILKHTNCIKIVNIPSVKKEEPIKIKAFMEVFKNFLHIDNYLVIIYGRWSVRIFPDDSNSGETRALKHWNTGGDCNKENGFIRL